MSNPSLILPQSPAYGEDYVYAAQVEDGAVPLYNVLPLTFTRASGGTRINKDGLVQNMPYNLALQSENFDNAIWDKNSSAVLITANATTAPNGTLTADKVENNPSSSNTPWMLQFFDALIGGQNYTYSLYAKAATSATKQIAIWNNSSSWTYQNISVTTEWQRFEFPFVANASATQWAIGLEFNGAETEYFIWGAQLNIGSTAQPYLATTDGLNMPRITYPIGGGCGALLLEKQSTNINTYSEDFSNAVYSKEYGTITTNQTTSPDGTSNADQFTDNSTNNYHIVYPNSLSITTSRVTASIYVKNNDIQFCAFQLATTIGGTYDTRFTLIVDLINGTITDSEQVGTPNAVYSIQNVGNGWYRLNLTCDHSAGSVAFVVGGSNSGTPLSYLAALPVYVGTGKSLFIWGAQIEASSYATSYIPTTSTSATRIADACYKTGISNLIGQTEGTIIADITPQIFNDSAYQTVAIIYPSYGLSGATYFHFYKNTGSKTLFFEVWNATSQCSLSYTMANNTRYKVAAGYKNNDFVLYVNGVQVGSDTSGTIGAVSYSTLEMGYDSFNIDSQMSLSEFVLFKTRLTNAELATLTTL